MPCYGIHRAAAYTVRRNTPCYSIHRAAEYFKNSRAPVGRTAASASVPKRAPCLKPTLAGERIALFSEQKQPKQDGNTQNSQKCIN